jgi:hypothetical protein
MTASKLSFPRLFGRAKGILMERGWLKGGYGGHGQLCLVHALNIALDMELERPEVDYTYRDGEDADRMREITARAIAKLYPAGWETLTNGEGGFPLEAWNDNQRRQESHIYNVLDEAELLAKELEAGIIE